MSYSFYGICLLSSFVCAKAIQTLPIDLVFYTFVGCAFALGVIYYQEKSR